MLYFLPLLEQSRPSIELKLWVPRKICVYHHAVLYPFARRMYRDCLPVFMEWYGLKNSHVYSEVALFISTRAQNYTNVNHNTNITRHYSSHNKQYNKLAILIWFISIKRNIQIFSLGSDQRRFSEKTAVTENSTVRAKMKCNSLNLQ